MKAIKINNAAWIPTIADHIETFCRKAHVDGIQAGNLQAYFAQSAQFGGSASEFWVVFEDDKCLSPVAFAMWYVQGLPHIAKVYCMSVHSWTKDKRAVEMLTDEFVKFGKKHRAVWWGADFVGKANVRLFSKKMKDRGFDMKESNVISCTFRRGSNG